MAQVAAISQQIWDMKYRLKSLDGVALEGIDLVADEAGRRHGVGSRWIEVDPDGAAGEGKHASAKA